VQPMHGCAKVAEVTEVIVGCAEDMKAFWEDDSVQEMLRRKKVRMEEELGLCVLHPLLPCCGTRSRKRLTDLLNQSLQLLE
jgi:hypothetical protein